MEPRPLIILYTSEEQAEESNKLRTLIDKTGLSYEEHHVDQERHSDLIVQFGGQVQVPGIQVDNLWIAEHEENIAEFIGKYWLDKMLASTADPVNAGGDDTPAKKTSKSAASRRASVPACRSTKMTKDIEFDPNTNMEITALDAHQKVGVTSRSLLVSSAPDGNASVVESLVDEWTVFTDPTFAMDDTVTPPSPPPPDSTEEGIEITLPAPLLHEEDELSTPESFLSRPIRLPSGSDVPVVNLMRLLLGATQHECIANGNVLYYFFRGHEGINVWRGLFFDRDAENSEQEAVTFGRMLIAQGLVHNYTPKVESLHHCFLVLQPLQEPRLLNTFLMLPPLTETMARRNADPMQVIMKLSHDMDVLCDELESSHPRDLVSRFHQFEESVCQLQVVSFPTDPRDKVTFGLNLFNLIVRHVMLLSNDALLKHGGVPRHWRLSWPKSLEQMEHFMRTVCYCVDGKCYNLASLRDSLYGHVEQSIPIIRQGKMSWSRLLLCCKVKPESLEGVHYASAVVRDGDPRILFAMSWGTQSSPIVSTIYPERLSEGLQTHAELYCQHNVVVKDGKVILPSLLSWHREDFGRDPETVLYKILGFLSSKQLESLRANKGGGKLEVVFSNEHNWTPGLQQAPRLREASTQRQQQPPVYDEIELDEVVNEPAAAVPEPILLNDPTPLGPSGRSINSKTTSSKSTNSLRSIFDRQIIQRLTRLTRGTSRGDMQPAPYHRGFQQDTSIEEEEDIFDEDNFGGSDVYDDDDDNLSFFQSTVSGITYGSEFEDLLLGARTNRRLQI